MLNEPAYQNLRDHQRQLDQDGVEVGVSRQALDEVLNAYAAMQTPHGAMLLIVADAMDHFWNAALTQPQASQDYSAMQTMGGMVEGVYAVAAALRAAAANQKPARIEAKVYKDTPEHRSYLTARFADRGRTAPSFEWEGHRWAYSHTAFDDQGDYDLLWRPAVAESTNG